MTEGRPPSDAPPAEVLTLLRRNALFSQAAPSARLTDLARELDELSLAPGEILFRQGDAAEGLFLVADGRLTVEAEAPDGSPRRIGAVGPDECVGEGALLGSGRRAATVRAESPCRLLRLSRRAFESALAGDLELGRVLGVLIAERLPGLRAITTELFGEMDDAFRAELGSALSWVSLERDAVLFRQGDPGDGLYVLIDGRLEVLHERADGRVEVVAELGRGEPVGEMALLTREARSSTVRAIRDCHLLKLSGEGFEAVVRSDPGSVLPVVRTLVRRLRETTAGVGRRPARVTTVALVPLGPDVPLGPLREALRARLARRGATVELDADRFDAEHGAGASRSPAESPRWIYFAEWLSRIEVENDSVVYVAGLEPGEWSARCLRQADRVLVVARGDSEPGLGRFARLLGPEGTSARRELILLHESGARRPTGTAAWRAVLPGARHHHVRLDRDEDARRVARFVAGTAVGLVLGGGGARGLAHAGVQRALAEAGVPIDMVGGTSMGAMVGACIALGFGPGETLGFLRTLWLEERLASHYTLPLISVFSPTRGERALRRLWGETHIEDLWIEYFAAASNITRGVLQPLRSGPLWLAVRASGAFPGLLPPVPKEGELLADGGLLVNLPVDELRQLCPGPVIACDVSREVELKVDPSLTLAPSPFEALRARLRRGGRVDFPGPGTVLRRSIESRDAQAHRRRRERADLYLKPPLDDFGIMELGRLEEIADVGYRYAKRKLDPLPAELAAAVD